MRLTLPYPPSSNRYWQIATIGGTRRGPPCVVKTAEAREYQRAAALIARQQGARPLMGDLRFRVQAFRPRRNGDLNNIIDVPLDALQNTAFANDRQIAEIHAVRREDPDRPRLEIEIDHADAQLWPAAEPEHPAVAEAASLRAALDEIAGHVRQGNHFAALDAVRRLCG